MTVQPRQRGPAPDGELPEFERPPLAEVVLGIQFDPLVGLSAARMGEVWGLFRDEFPNTEDHSPLAATFERLGTPAQPRELRFDLDLMRPSLPRCWMISARGDELLQFQQDRFHHNWRREGNAHYPRYTTVRARFESEATRLAEYIARSGVGAVEVNQCELAYVNHIVADDVWSHHGEVGRVFRSLAAVPRESLGEQEHVRFETSFLIVDDGEEPRGRLHVSLVSGTLHEGAKRMLALTLTARGEPIGSGVPGALEFLDLGRRWIVHGFTELTTERMHAVWGRTR